MFQFLKMMRFPSLLSHCTPIAQSHCHIVGYKWFTAPLEFSKQTHLLFLPLISLHSCSLVTIGHYIKTIHLASALQNHHPLYPLHIYIIITFNMSSTGQLNGKLPP